MATDLYDLTVPVFIRGLNTLSHLLDKGAAFAAERGMDPQLLTEARLIADMNPLTAQIQSASDTAKGTVIRLAQLDPYPMPDGDRSFEQLQARIERTIAFLQSVPREKIDGREEAEVVLKTQGGDFRFGGREHVLSFSIPNFFFHVTTTYALLRQAGVPIGKLDYLGANRDG